MQRRAGLIATVFLMAAEPVAAATTGPPEVLDFNFQIITAPSNGGGAVEGVIRGLIHDGSPHPAASVSVTRNRNPGGFGVGTTRARR